MGNSTSGYIYADSALSGNHLQGLGGTPTVTVGGGAGTGATASVVGTDTSGTITVNVGTSPNPASNAPVVTLTFSTAFVTAPHPVFAPANVSAVQFDDVYILSTSTTKFVLASYTSLAASRTYIWNYVTIQ